MTIGRRVSFVLEIVLLLVLVVVLGMLELQKGDEDEDEGRGGTKQPLNQSCLRSARRNPSNSALSGAQ